MMLSNRVKKYIQDNIELLENNKLVDFFLGAEFLFTHELAELGEALESVGVKTTEARWTAFEVTFKEEIEYHLGTHLDAANSWSRLDYILNDITNMGFGYMEAKEYVIENASKLGVSCKPLPPQYGWEGVGDYDLGWFNKKEFERSYW